MVERGAHQPGGVDLRDPAVAGAGEPRVSFDPADRGDHGFVMSVFDLRPNLGTAKRPQQRHRLHRGEDQVIARDRASLTSGGARSAARSDKLTIRRVTPARQPALCWRRDSVVDDGEECDPWRAGEQGGKWRQAAGVLDALEVVGADPVLDGVDPSFGVGEDLFVPSVTVSTPRLYGWGIVDAAAAVQYVGLRPPDDDR
jgi:hypothetical protein